MTYPFTEQDITIYRGENLRQPMAFKTLSTIGGPATPLNLTGCTVSMTLACLAGTSFAAYSVTKTSPASGVTITDAVNGLAEALFSVADLANIPDGVNSRWRILLTEADGDTRVWGAGAINMKTVP